jgi:hypothetical protein
VSVGKNARATRWDNFGGDPKHSLRSLSRGSRAMTHMNHFVRFLPLSHYCTIWLQNLQYLDSKILSPLIHFVTFENKNYLWRHT